MTAALLAATGADAGIVTILAIIAATLGGLGIVLMVVRVAVRRRERTRQTPGEHPVP